MTQSFFFSKCFTVIWGEDRSPSWAQRAFLEGCQIGGRHYNGSSNSVDTFSDHTYSCTTGLNAIALNVTCQQVERWI